MEIKMIRVIFPVLFIVFLSTGIIHANDTLFVKSGEKIIGKIKTMDNDVISVETDYSDSDFMIDWTKVTEIYSDRMFIITTLKGDRYYGTIKSDKADKSKVKIVEEGKEYISNISDVVFINQVDKDFLSRLSASIDIGFSYAKTNNLTQFSMRSNLGYLTDTWTASAYYNRVNNTQDDVDPTKRNEGGLNFRYFLPADWFVSASYSFLQNDEQKLKLRSISQLGIGNYLIRTNSVYLSAAAGAAWNNESYTAPAIASRNSGEGFAGLELNIDELGDLSILSALSVYPSFTESGRVRSDFKLDLKYDFPLDIYFKLGYTLNYDNKPVEGASEVDYLFQTTVGWEL
jgi:hypothetical protein